VGIGSSSSLLWTSGLLGCCAGSGRSLRLLANSGGTTTRSSACRLGGTLRTFRDTRLGITYGRVIGLYVRPGVILGSRGFAGAYFSTTRRFAGGAGAGNPGLTFDFYSSFPFSEIGAFSIGGLSAEGLLYSTDSRGI